MRISRPPMNSLLNRSAHSRGGGYGRVERLFRGLSAAGALDVMAHGPSCGESAEHCEDRADVEVRASEWNGRISEWRWFLREVRERPAPDHWADDAGEADQACDRAL